MNKVYIDSDIILDILVKRPPFYHAAASLFSCIDKKLITGYVSPLIFSNLYYVLRKQRERDFALNSLRKLRLLVEIVLIDRKIIDLALTSDFKDFEDAIQYYAARENNIEYLITRNVKHYPTGPLSVCTAEEYLEMINVLH